MLEKTVDTQKRTEEYLMRYKIKVNTFKNHIKEKLDKFRDDIQWMVNEFIVKTQKNIQESTQTIDDKFAPNNYINAIGIKVSEV